MNVKDEGASQTRPVASEEGIMKYKFECICKLTDEEIYNDIASVVKLTGEETQGEMDRLHEDIFHPMWDNIPDWDDFDFWGTETPTTKELAIEQKEKRRKHQVCSICPPNKGENASRKVKHGIKKPKYKDHRK